MQISILTAVQKCCQDDHDAGQYRPVHHEIYRYLDLALSIKFT